MSKYRAQTIAALARLGVTDDDIQTLIRCSMTLHTWAEHECNGAIQRDEKTDKPYWHSMYDGKRMGRAADRENGALARAKAAAERHGLKLYHQTDPRGCALYVYRQKDLMKYVRDGEPPTGIDSCYNSVGIAVVP